MNKQDGYDYGILPGLKLVRYARKMGISEITFYGFTMDNCKRPKIQVQAFQKACIKAADLVTKDGADLFVLGNATSPCFPKELLPYQTRQPVHGGGIRINLLINYGWNWDLSHIKKDGKPYSHQISRIDLILRFGGMRRLSGFLPIQYVYSDFYIAKPLWPDYCDQDLDLALKWYQTQDDTLGG